VPSTEVGPAPARLNWRLAVSQSPAAVRHTVAELPARGEGRLALLVAEVRSQERARDVGRRPTSKGTLKQHGRATLKLADTTR
jgi:hypothetical protein